MQFTFSFIRVTIVAQTTVSELIDQMVDAHTRELDIFSDLTDDQMLGPKMHLIEPPIWELGHVGWFYELWILRYLDKAEPLIKGRDSIYDSFNVSYKLRWDHPFPSKAETLDYVAEVLKRCIDRLKSRTPSEEEIYFYRMATFHEDMHSENLLLILQTLEYPRPSLSGVFGNGFSVEIERDFELHDVKIPGGTFLLGATRDTSFVFDNEKWAHPVEVSPFRISATPVINTEYQVFVESGGYHTRKYWGKRGWEWRRRECAEYPIFWQREPDGTWCERRFESVAPLNPYHPVIHVNWYEAIAYCAWAGRRLPTEAEWELAASAEPSPDGKGIKERKRKYPWGEMPPSPDRANLDSLHMGCIDVRALPAGDSAFGCRQMIGNVWEWTSDVLAPFPGFEADPYKEYSEPYFGKKKVLRGGAWPTRSRLIRNTWRNFYIRHRRNVFAGFRTVAL